MDANREARGRILFRRQMLDTNLPPKLGLNCELTTRGGATQSDGGDANILDVLLSKRTRAIVPNSLGLC